MLYQRAVDAGNLPAMLDLAYLHFEQEPAKAEDLLRGMLKDVDVIRSRPEAEEQALILAAFDLGLLLARRVVEVAVLVGQRGADAAQPGRTGTRLFTLVRPGQQEVRGSIPRPAHSRIGVAMPTTEEGRDVIAVLRQDHQHVEELFQRVQDHARFRNRRKEIADQIIIELVRHAVAEEQYVYPVVRDGAGGQEVVDHALAVNAAAEALMRQLEPLIPTDEVFDQVLIKLMAATRSRVADEEAQLFPHLAAACLPTELRELGERVQAGKSVRPTRPYPSAPTTPLGNLPVGPALSLIDRVRDALAYRGEHDG